MFGLTGYGSSLFGGGREPGDSFFSAIADLRNIRPLDLPWYRRGWERIDSFRMPSASSSSNYWASSSSPCESSTTELDVGGATTSAEGVRGVSTRDPLGWDCSDVGIRASEGPDAKARTSLAGSLSERN